MHLHWRDQPPPLQLTASFHSRALKRRNSVALNFNLCISIQPQEKHQKYVHQGFAKVLARSSEDYSSTSGPTRRTQTTLSFSARLRYGDVLSLRTSFELYVNLFCVENCRRGLDITSYKIALLRTFRGNES